MSRVTQSITKETERLHLLKSRADATSTAREAVGEAHQTLGYRRGGLQMNTQGKQGTTKETDRSGIHNYVANFIPRGVDSSSSTPTSGLSFGSVDTRIAEGLRAASEGHWPDDEVTATQVSTELVFLMCSLLSDRKNPQTGPVYCTR